VAKPRFLRIGGKAWLTGIGVCVGVPVLYALLFIAQAVMAVLILVVLPPALALLPKPYHVEGFLIEARKALSLAPGADESAGERLLAHSHDAIERVARYPVVSFAPDAKSFVVLASDGVLVRIDVESGRSLGRFGEPRGRYESPSVQWSPNGRLLALRTDGDEVKIPGTIYTRRQSRVRLLTVPDYHVVAEFWSRGEACFQDMGSRGLMFEGDGASLWLLCGPGVHYPKAGDVAAVRLDVPSLEARLTRRYEPGEKDSAMRGLLRVGDGVWAWEHSYRKGARMRLHDLSSGRQPIVLPDLTTPDLASGLTLQSVEVENARLVLPYCGLPTAVSGSSPAPANVVNPRYCRHLFVDPFTGRLTGKREGYDLRPSWPEASAGGLRVQAYLDPESKRGKTVVRDAATGRERQRISGVAQRPLAISPDGRWLVAHAVDRSILRIYRVTH